jgi:hypothetical protein
LSSHGYQNRTTSLTSGPRSHNILALATMLILCLVTFFVVAGGEAWAAEQPSQTTQPGMVQSTMTTNGKVAEPATGVTPPVELPPVETPPAEESSPPPPSNEETPPAEEPSPPPVEPAPSVPEPEPEPAPQPTSQPAPQWFAVVVTDGEIVESEPVVTSWTTPEPEQAPDVAYPALGSAAPVGDSGSYVPSTSADDSWPTGSPVEEDAMPTEQGASDPVVGSVAASDPVAAPESATLLPESVRGLVSESVISRGTDPQPAPAVFKQATAAATVPALVKGATRLPSSLDTTAATAVSSAVGTVRNAVATAAASVAAEVLGTLTGGSPSNSSTNGSQEQPSEGTPQPASAPLAPPVGGGQFSLSMGSGGNVGPGGGFAPVLLGMLALAAILLKRDFRTYLVSCEMPKPSSALLLPLERPG